MPDRQETTCAEVRRDGQPCRAAPLPGNDHCWAHAPELAEKREAARQAGGLNSSGPARVRRMLPSRLAPVATRLEKALAEVHTGKLEPPRAQAMASLSRALMAVFTGGELEERLRRLEELAAQEGRETA